VASPEIISLLCAGTVKYHAALGGHGAPLLTRGEIAGLLAGLPPEAMDLALAKYAGDLAAERLLVAKVRAWAAGLAVAEEWEIERGRPTLCNMSALAVFEVVRPNRCGTCHGTGYKGARLCPSCDGAGVRQLAGVTIAQACGLSQPDYSRKWQSRYGQVLQHVQGLDSRVNGVLHRNLNFD